MSLTDLNDDSSRDNAHRPSIVQHFSISGLFGYRTLSLESDYAATILIARNGAGKTTMLGALDAFLKGQFGRLTDLNFAQIKCTLRNVPTPLVLSKSDLDEFMSIAAENSDLLRMSKVYEIPVAELLFFTLWEYPTIAADITELNQHPVYTKIYQQSSYRAPTVDNHLKSLLQSLIANPSPVYELRSSVVNAMSDIDIVYLPTYRRIELSLPEADETRNPTRKPLSVQAKLGLTRRGLHAGDIQFGLADISARLKKLNQEILAESNQQYAESSANIIDDLISGAFELQSPSLEDRPSEEELAIFFNRLKAAGREVYFRNYFGPYGPIKIPDVSRIYRGQVPQNSEKFLTYFLGKLNTVIKKIRETERVVESFVASCNRYLSANDVTTDLDYPAPEEHKELKLNRATLDVSVWRQFPEKEIPLDALSSGEKQMVSLFARLYLYPKNKLILIDEPELSLSLDWQRKILPDILNAKSCSQVVAITHSPFIFDNDLDRYAKSLKVVIDDNDSAAGA